MNLYCYGNGNGDRIAQQVDTLLYPLISVHNRTGQAEGQAAYNTIMQESHEPNGVVFWGLMGGQSILWSVVVEGGLNVDWVNDVASWHRQAIDELKSRGLWVLVGQPQGVHYFAKNEELRVNAEALEVGLDLHYQEIRSWADDFVDLSLSRLDPEVWDASGIHTTDEGARRQALRVQERVASRIMSM